MTVASFIVEAKGVIIDDAVRLVSVIPLIVTSTLVLYLWARIGALPEVKPCMCTVNKLV
jgi:hypothetical protein